MVASLTRARINHSSCSSFSMPETRCTFGGAPLSAWTGKTEREGTGHTGGHDLTAAPGYFQAKLHLARLTGNCTISETHFPGPQFPSPQLFPVLAPHLFFLRHCCSPFPGNPRQDLGSLPPSSSQNSKDAWEKPLP